VKRVAKRGIAIGLAIFGFVLSLAAAPRKPPTGGGADAKSYSHDAHGLEKQFDPLMKAYAKGDRSAIDKEYGVFVLPAANKWLAEYFSASDVEQLGWDYESESDGFKNTLPGMMKILAPHEKFRAHCSPPDPNHKSNLQPSADARVPTKDVPVEQFQVQFAADNGRTFSILANFVYVDGAYRYLGKGAYPFWSMPDATKKK
jgi:hypothetical protein